MPVFLFFSCWFVSTQAACLVPRLELAEPNALVVEEPNRLLPVFVLLPNSPEPVPVEDEPNKLLPDPNVDVGLLPKRLLVPKVDPPPNAEDDPNILIFFLLLNHAI